MMKKLYTRLTLLLTLALSSAAGLWAQGTNATATGRIVDAAGEPVVGVAVVVKNESTGFTTGAITGIDGSYAIRQLPLGSPYTVTASFIGYGTQERTGFTLGQGDVLQVDFTMREESVQIATVQVVGESLRQGIDRLGTSTSISPDDIHALPVNGRDFSALMDLSPLSSGGAMMGQLGSSTSYMIDGMTARGPLSGGMTNRGNYLLSMESIREFEVVTNDYDVTLGRAGGGAVSAVTRSGTNTLTGSAFLYHRADQLQSQYNINGTPRTADFQISQYGVSLGGPIVKDKLHFYVTWDHQSDRRPMLIADLRAGEIDEKRVGITQENLDRYLEIARSQYGVADTPQTGEFDKIHPTDNVFARVDWQIDATNLLTIRENFNRDVNQHGVGDNSNINLFETYGTHVSQDNSLLASLRSVLGPRLLNEVKLQYLYTKDDGRPNDQLPSSNIPRAVVNVTSQIDGNPTTRTVQLGGQRYLPETFINNVFQLVDQLYYSTDRIDYTFGVDLMYTHLNSLATSEMNGIFSYASLDDFAANRPYSYSREVPVGDPTVKQGVFNGALYAQMSTNIFPGGQLEAGIRADYTGYFNQPIDDPLLTQELGLHTDNKLRTLQIQPRVQLTWDVGERQTDIIRVGAGVFGSNMNNYAMVNNLEFNGQRVVKFERQVDLLEESLGITPDFDSYRRDPSTAPGVELFNRFGMERQATYNINGADLKMPVLYKASLSYNHFFSDRLRLGLSLYGSWARNNYMYVDRNMVDEPYFRLDNEGGRGVYVPASSIAANGNTNFMEGRKSNKIVRVLELNSEGKIDSYSVVVDGAWNYWRDGALNFSYTYNTGEQNTTYNGNVANSATLGHYVADDPRDLSRMFPLGVARHKVVFYGTSPSWKGFTVGLSYIGTGGSRYSMLVSGNNRTGGVNGDFVNNNDLAFVFDPTDPSTPTAIRDRMNEILADPDVAEGFKEYLRDNFGRIAERNGGINGFHGVWDLHVAKKFSFYRTHGFELSVDIFNVANLLDKEWGSYDNSLGNQTLLNIDSFDQETQQFNYRMGNVGVPNVSGTPWQLQLGLKYSF